LPYDYEKILDDIDNQRKGLPPAPLPAVPAPVNPALDTLGMNLQRAATANPVDEAKRRKLSGELGMPAAILPPTAQAEEQAFLKNTRAQDIMTKYPALAKWAQNPNYAAVAGKDILTLGEIETTARGLPSLAGDALQVGKNLAGSAAAALPNANAAIWSFVQAAGSILSVNATKPLADTIGSPDVGEMLRSTAADFRNRQLGMAKDLRPNQSGLSVLERGVYSGVESAATTLMALPLSVASGSPVPILAGLSGITAGNALGEATDKGLPLNEALIHATKQGVIEYATELFPMGNLVKNLTMKTGLVRTATEFMIREGVGEQAATALQDLDKWATLNPEKPFSDYLAERPEAALETLIATAVGGSIQVGGAKAVAKGMETLQRSLATDLGKAQRAEENHLTIQQLGEMAGKHPLRERDPQAFHDFISTMSEDGNLSDVYVDGKTLENVLNQSGVNMAEIERKMPEVAQQLGEAAKTNGEVRISLADYATYVAGTDVEKGIIDHLRASPDGLTYTEAQQFYQSQKDDLSAQAASLMADAGTTEEYKADVQKVHDTILEQMNKAGRFTSEVNAAYAVPFREFYAVNAAKMGITPSELYKQMPLNFAPMNTGNILNQGEDTFDFSPGIKDAKVGDSTLSYGMEDGALKIYSVRTPQAKRGKGSARQAMVQFLQQADREGKAVTLDASSLDKKTSTGKLITFYESLGFVKTGRTINALGEPEMRREPQVFNQSVFHGTPHVWAPEPGFPHGRPRLDKMGTGEGAQAFGWGWYSAENQGVAREYREKLTASAAQADNFINQFGGLDEAIAGLEKRLSGYEAMPQSDRRDSFIKLTKESLDQLGRRKRGEPENEGSLYSLDIPDSVLPRLLDWDKPLSEQTPEVREALKGIKLPDPKYMDGKEIYSYIKELQAEKANPGQRSFSPSEVNRHDKAASEYLASIGIVGNRYLDGGSRADGKGTYNYVLWDQPTIDKVALLERNGEKLDAMRELAQSPMIPQTETPEFKAWFGDSKVVDAEGNPLRLFHGTDKTFDKFDLKKFGQKDSGWYGKGIYLTADTHAASGYATYESKKDKFAESGGANVMPVYVSLKNPYYWPKGRVAATNAEETKAITEELLAAGHDGVIVPNEYADPESADFYEVIAFSPDQIKSAIGNNGQFAGDTLLNQENRAGYNPDTFTISLLKGADLSSTLHEGAHFYLEALADLASRPEAPQQIKDDFRKTLEWFGITGNENTDGGTRGGDLGQSPLNENFRVWSNNAPLVTSAQAETHQFKTGEKIVVEAFHGTGRPDRVGDKFLKKRATSGPMAYHTSSPALASNYASGKMDTSLANEDQDYSNWFKVKVPGSRNPVDIARAWYSLDSETKARIAEIAPTLRLDDDAENVISEDGNTSGNGSYDYNVQQTRTYYDRRGNPLRALVEDWLSSGTLFNNEELFMRVLKEAGMPMKDVTYDSPHSSFPFVYKNYIAMRSPLVTSDIPASVGEALNAAAKRDRSKAKLGGADAWDKNNRTMRDWVEEFNNANGKESHVWTSIPDKVTEVLKSLGYDGIVDWSGKNKGGGVVAPVYIPFEETQVKSALGNKGKFNTSKNNILNQGGDPGTPGDLPPGRTPEEVWASMSLDQKRPYHEQWAQSFERYMLEGKAPTTELQPVFARFRAWMLNVYKSLEAFLKQNPLAGKLNDEVRGIFARLIAAGESIKATEAVRGYAPLFETAEDAGVTPKQFQEYIDLGEQATEQAIDDLSARSLRDMKWLSNAKERVIKELQNEAKAKRKAVEEEVRREVMAEPIEVARTFLKTGELPGMQTEPPLVPGMVRVYHSGSAGNGTDGRWVSTDRTYASDYRADLPLFYTDLPENDPRVNNPDYEDQGVKQGFTFNFELKPEEAAALSEISRGSKAGFKLDTAALDELFPAGGTVTLDRAKLRGMTAKDGLSPDLAAQMFGYPSGESLILDLANSESAKDKIEGTTDQRMLERHGELSSEEDIERAAEAAIHNEARAKFMATGLKILAKSPIPATQINRAAKAAAENAIASRKVRDLRPAQYERAETKANKEALKLAAKDPKAAVSAQRAALLNNRLAKAAAEASKEVEKILRYVAKFQTEGTRKALDIDYMEQIDDLLRPFDFRKGQTLSQIDKRQSLADWVSQQEAMGFEPAIDPALLDAAKLKSYKNMTVEELRGFADSIKQIEHLGRLKKKLLLAKDQREFDAIVLEGLDAIEANANRTVEERATPTDAIGIAGKWWRQMTADHRKFSSIMREMDGGKDNGFMFNFFLKPMNEAGDNETQMKAAATEALAKLFKQITTNPVTGNLYAKKRMVPGTNLSMTHEQRIMFAMNWGNEGNRQRLMDGGITGNRALSIQQAEAVLDTLTEAEWNFVQGVWDYIAEFKPQVAALERRLTGVEPEWIEPAPIKTKYGTYKGGYFPVKYDAELSSRSESFEAATDLRMGMKGAFNASATRNGFTKARADAVMNRPILLSYNAIAQHVSEVTHRLAWQEWLIDSNRLLKALDNPIRQHYGAEILRTLRDTVVDIAAGDAPAKNGTETAINRLRVGSTVVGMGWRVTTALLQPSGLAQSWVRVGGKYMARGVAQFMKSPLASGEFVNSKSKLMTDRGRTMQREINEVLNTIRAGDKVSAFKASYFTLIGKMQRTVDIPTWLGAYEKATDQLNLQNAGSADERKAIEEQAAALADQSVLDAQSGGQLKDLAKVQRGSPLQKIFTNFYSYFSATYNLNVEAVRRTSFKSPSQVAMLATDLVLLNSVPVLFSVALKELLKGECGEDLECLTKKLGHEQLGFLFGQMVLLREMGVAIDVAAGGQGFGYQGPAGLRFFADLYKLGQQANQGDADMAFFKAANQVGGALLHYPAGQINATVEGIMAIEEGKVDGMGILPALVAGPPKK
jgi:hypothetical protein